jgi:hypothetical protein
MLPSVSPVVRSMSSGVWTLRWRMMSRMFGRELGDPVDDRVAERLALVVPRPELGCELVRRVLDEAADDVLAGRRHRRVDQASG